MNEAGLIQFHFEDIEFELKYPDRYIQWIQRLVDLHKSSISEINYVFCSDDYLLEINKEHLNHDYYTDIITFPLSKDPIEADIFISIDRVKDNASTFGLSEQDELLRVMAHGILHLIGFDDKSDEKQKIMREKEEEAMTLFSA